ncbi:class I SAM-dependent methyltransferase [Aquabacterium sp. J223]|uniref:class I SAM-dependent methyltransferase n=1 Tax=Aquabacterium sp. J223 TaxID=2898431 RepID=UPI002898BEC9|nr:class I SAM-dependent methyltransferase [Aquabacterium sp. J223]
MSDKTHWDRVYQNQSAEDVSWFQPHAQQSLDLIGRICNGQSSRVIDVGGGASTLVDDLLDRRTFQVSVLDLSSAALDVAKRRLGARSRSVQWLVGDITNVALPEQSFDIWHDRAVFHFLTERSQREAYVAQVRRAVRPGGHVIVAAFGPDGPLRCSGLPVVRFAPRGAARGVRRCLRVARPPQRIACDAERRRAEVRVLPLPGALSEVACLPRSRSSSTIGNPTPTQPTAAGFCGPSG